MPLSPTSSTEEPIHSGHFMKSIVHSSSSDEELEVDVCTTEADDGNDTAEDNDSDVRQRRRSKEDREKPVTFYSFGPTRAKQIVIDDSLGQLKKAIHTAYDRMTTPKWKDFKGLRLDWKKRIRLNNVIWRAWFREFGHRNRRRAQRSTGDFKTGNINWPRALTGDRVSRFCYYSLPEDDQHSKIEGNVLEGMYWKRRQEAVAAQYRKWRHFWANRISPASKVHKWRRCEKHQHPKETCPIDAHLLPANQAKAALCRETSTENKWDNDDDYANVFTDRLFDSLAQPYMFPDPKEIAQAGNADIIQPGLSALQPSLEEIMRCLDDTDDYDNRESNFHFGGYGKGKRSPMKETPAQPIAHKAPRLTQPNSLLSPNHARSLLVNCSAQSAPQFDQLSPNSAFHRMPSSSHSNLVYTTSNNYGQPPTTLAYLQPAPLQRHWAPQQLLPGAYLQSTSSDYAHPNVVLQRVPRTYNNDDAIFHPPTSIVDAKGVQKKLIVPLKKRTPSGNTRVRPPPTKARKLTPIVQEGADCGGGILVTELAEQPSTSTRAAADSSDPSTTPGDRKRLLHLQAEQSRREALKDGFIQIEDLLPETRADGMKQTNAVVLARAVDYIQSLVERARLHDQVVNEKRLKVEQLKRTVAAYQSQLPTSSSSSAVSLTPQQVVIAQFDRHVAMKANHKYWLLARVLRSALHAAHDGETRGVHEAIVQWASEHCSLMKLRPATSELLVELVTKCPQMIAQPHLLQEYIEQQINSM